MISAGLTEEQVLNSFIDLEPTQLTQPETIHKRGLSINMMDIWSSDDEEAKKGIDVWEGERQWEVGHVASTKQKKEKKKEEPVEENKAKAEPETKKKRKRTK